MRLSYEDDLLRMNARRKQRSSSSAGRRSNREKASDWLRALQRAAVVLLLVGVAWQGLIVALQPHCLTWLTQKKTRELLVRQQVADRGREDLDWAYLYSGSERGVQTMLRMYGFVRSNEIPIILPLDSAPALPPAAADPTRPTLWERFMSLVCRFCGVELNTIG